jgi:hypothetical protein
MRSAEKAGELMDRDTIRAALAAAGGNVTAAARNLGVYPETLRYRVKIMGLVQTKAPARAEQHAPTAALLHRLEELRTRARAIIRIYLPGPARAAFLRDIETEQRAILLRLRPLLGVGVLIGGVRGSYLRGSIRPSWDCWR